MRVLDQARRPEKSGAAASDEVSLRSGIHCDGPPPVRQRVIRRISLIAIEKWIAWLEIREPHDARG
jgi:hypothetical protein